MEKTARGILIVKKEKSKYLVSIKRTKYREDGEYVYYTFPGGHVENYETYEETLIREIEEELGINVKIKSVFEEFYNEDLKRNEKFFICEYVSGTFGTGTGPEFTNIDLKKYGKYEIEYLPIDKIEEYNLLPKEISRKIAETIK